MKATLECGWVARSAKALIVLAAGLSGCAGGGPQPMAAAPAVLQQASVAAQLPAGALAAADTPILAWRDWVREPRLTQWVELALQNNRDLRVALLNVQRAQAQLGLVDANRLPTLGVGLNAGRSPNYKGVETTGLSAGLQVSAWELDLYGRLASLSDAARAQLLATEAGRQAVAVSLVAGVVQVAGQSRADARADAVARIGGCGVATRAASPADIGGSSPRHAGPTAAPASTGWQRAGAAAGPALAVAARLCQPGAG
ncbi:MAG: hypothetical protein EBY28_06820 [Betaproteobacteria bacterium]|nr:hypothetical protein [Betaproteobacteria bacterium]